MSEIRNDYGLKESPVSKSVVKIYRAIETGVVGAYRWVENGVVGGYRRVERAFVEVFLEKEKKHDSQH